MLSGNKYTSRSSLGSAIYQCLQQIPKEDYLICLSRLGKQVTKMCFSKGGILWRFVIKIGLIKRSTEVIRTQWQNFLQDPRTHHHILQDSYFDFRYVRLCVLDKLLNYLQTMEALIRRCALRRLIWVCTVCQYPFMVFQATMDWFI